MAEKIKLEIRELSMHKRILRNALDTLNNIGNNYKGSMDEMVNVWKGTTGKSFAVAAGRVEAGFIINARFLEQIIEDLSKAIKLMRLADAEISELVDSVQVL